MIFNPPLIWSRCKDENKLTAETLEGDSVFHEAQYSQNAPGEEIGRSSGASHYSLGFAFGESCDLQRRVNTKKNPPSALKKLDENPLARTIS
jgi:hypothetical protein